MQLSCGGGGRVVVAREAIVRNSRAGEAWPLQDSRRSASHTRRRGPGKKYDDDPKTRQLAAPPPTQLVLLLTDNWGLVIHSAQKEGEAILRLSARFWAIALLKSWFCPNPRESCLGLIPRPTFRLGRSHGRGGELRSVSETNRLSLRKISSLRPWSIRPHDTQGISSHARLKRSHKEAVEAASATREK